MLSSFQNLLCYSPTFQYMKAEKDDIAEYNFNDIMVAFTKRGFHGTHYQQSHLLATTKFKSDALLVPLRRLGSFTCCSKK